MGGVHWWESPIRRFPTEHLRGIFRAGIGRPRPVTLTLGYYGVGRVVDCNWAGVVDDALLFG